MENNHKPGYGRREGEYGHHSNDDRREGGRTYQKHSSDGNRPHRPRKNFDGDSEGYRPRRVYSSDQDERPRRSFDSEGGDRPRRSFDGERPRFNKGPKDSRTPKGPRTSNDSQGYRGPKGSKGFRGGKSTRGNKPQKNSYYKGELAPRDVVDPSAQGAPTKPTYASKGLTRLNKYISNAGICSRRDADKLIEAGSVTVNGQVVTQMGYLVKEGDVVVYGGEALKSEAKRYFLMNKPKGYITTLDDPQERQTVMEIIEGACRERIYPVGRLDRNTTGLLLFTNDGELSKKLTHPSTGVYKVYQVELDRPVSREDMQKMVDGIELEDGPIHVDDVQYAVNAGDHPGIDKRIVGVQLHSGKNRIVRRIFESLGYNVHKLDRTVFAGLTKKDLPRGRYRELTDKEVNFLKMI